MSMLAEPRRKQRWTLNPRGKQWSEDSTKFGQRMLEKMGWTSGKGLGVNEQGITEHVRVTFKNDAAGIGFRKDDADKAWTEHQESFNDFLQRLQESQNSQAEVPEDSLNSLSGKSLEEKSKQSRARVHYQKFTRGKDVNKYSSKDLANIFGQRDINEKPIRDDPKEETENPDTQENESGVFTINSGTMTEYFKSKLPNFETSRENTNESDGEQYCGFGFKSPKPENEKYAFENPCLSFNSPEENCRGVPSINFEVTSEENAKNSPDSRHSSGKKSKKRKKELEDSQESKKVKSEGTEHDGFVNVALNLDSQADETRNGMEFEVSRTQFGLSNCALDLTDETEKKKRVTFNDHVEFSTDSRKVKKVTLDKFEVETGKKKKRKREEEKPEEVPVNGIVNQAFEDAIPEEVNDNEMNERKVKKVKRRKRRVSSLETIEETPEIETTELNGDVHNGPEAEPQETVKKKKKKKKEKEIPIDNVIADNTEIDIQVETKVKSKKKKKKEKGDKTSEEVTEISVTEETGKKSEESVKKKDKKKKHKDLSDVKVSTESEETQQTEADAEVSHEVSEEPKKSKKKKSKKSKETVPEDSSNAIANSENSEDVSENKLSTPSSKKSKLRFFTPDRTKTAEVSDKENTKEEKEKKKSKSSKESTEISVDENNAVKPETHVESENSDVSTPTDNYDGFYRCEKDRKRLSKRMLKTLFHRNAIMDFPGSNLHEIKGYGVDIVDTARQYYNQEYN